jgi:hypothetical protein
VNKTVTPRESVRRPETATLPWGALEVFVVVAMLSSALLFIPGAQSVRIFIRAIPYVLSLALLVRHWGEWRGRGTWRGQVMLSIAMACLAFGLFHPQASAYGGLAQLAFQLSIAAPAYWVMGEQLDPPRVSRLITLLFLVNAASALVGLLQVTDPARFMPPEFSQQAGVDQTQYLESLSYAGAEGKTIVRPPGLTDLPGGASGACAVAALLGTLMAFQPGRAGWQRLPCVVVAGAALVTLYLTQVRSMLIMTVIGFLSMGMLLARMGRIWFAGTIAGAGAALTVIAFLLAYGIGGQAVFDRFYNLYETGLVTSYRENRGIFLEYTFSHLVYEHPFGAGVGRWGMMNFHFARFDAEPPKSIWVEIQPTGWLVDGGIPLLVTYAGAIAIAMWQLYRITNPVRGGPLSYAAAIVFSSNLFLIGQSFAGPTFNSTSGMYFWLPTTAVFAADWSRRAAARTKERLNVR